MKLSDFDFELPEGLIATRPARPRTAARLLLAEGDAIRDLHVSDLVDIFRPGDRLVLNNTKVIPARLFGRRARGETVARVEITLLEAVVGGWKALAKPLRKVNVGEVIAFSDQLSATVSTKGEAFAAFMGDTRNRGKILWFLITCRPDLLPIDLKRQGRAEEHVPLFYPETPGEYDEIYRVMLKKLGIKTTVTDISAVADEKALMGLSGSDLEAVLVRATLEAEAEGVSEVSQVHLAKVFADFIPPNNSREREMQILCAVLESTSRELLPQKYRDMDRGEIQSRIQAIKFELRLS